MHLRTAVGLALVALGTGAATATASPPVVTSIERGGPEHNKDGHQGWVIHFDQGVYGLNANNVQVKRHPDGFGQATDVNFADGNSFAGVGVGTPSGSGTLAVHLINVSNIQNAAHEHMVHGDDFAEVGVFVDRDGPGVTIFGDPLTGGITSASPVRFLLDIDETPIKGLTGASVSVSGTAGATTATVVPDAGDPDDRVVEVSGMTGPGSVIITLNAGAFADELDNPSRAATFTAAANVAQYTGAGVAPGGGGGGGGAIPIGQLPISAPGPGPSPAPAPPPAPSGAVAAPKVVLGAGKLVLSRKGRVGVPVTCTTATASCTVAVAVRAGKRTLCSATAKVAAGRRVTVSVPCTKAGRSAIAKADKKQGLAVKVAVTVTDAAGAKATATKTARATRASA